MILSRFPRASEACPVCIGGGLPKRAGEPMQTDTGLKGRFYAPKTFVTGSQVDDFVRLMTSADLSRLPTHRLWSQAFREQLLSVSSTLAQSRELS